MELKMIIAGFGGQGVMVTGKLLGYTACANHKQAMYGYFVRGRSRISYCWESRCADGI